MHILLVHQAFASMDEAGGTRHHELSLQLSRLGHRVTIIASPVSYLTGRVSDADTSIPREQSAEPGITIHRAYTWPALHRSFIHRIFSFMSFMVSSFFTGLFVKKVDLVWGTSPPIFQAVTAWLLARLKGVPFVLEVRDLWPSFAIAVGVLRNRAIIALSEWLERFLYRHADRIIVNSPGYIQHVRDRSGRLVDLIPNGTDTGMFDPGNRNQALRDRLGLGDKFVVLYAGAHGMSNDLGIVLLASHQLRDQANIFFLFIGDGKEKPALQKQASDMGLMNILFLPPVPKAEISSYLAAADACIAILMPLEEYKTTYPNKVFDYMAAGRPVLLAIDGVIREVVEGASAGIFVPPGNPTVLAHAVLVLAGDPEKSRSLGMNGRVCVEQHFDRPRLALQLSRLFIEVAGRSGSV